MSNPSLLHIRSKINQPLSSDPVTFLYTQQNQPGNLTPLPLLFHIRKKSTSHSHAYPVTFLYTQNINQALSSDPVNFLYTQQNQPGNLTPFPLLVHISKKSTNHSHAYPVICPHTHTHTQKKQPATLTPIPSLFSIRNKINQPLSRLSRHFSLYDTKSTNHSPTNPVTFFYIQQNQSATLTPILSFVQIPKNQPATLSPIP
jgi:hypothetical protein